MVVAPRIASIAATRREGTAFLPSSGRRRAIRVTASVSAVVVRFGFMLQSGQIALRFADELVEIGKGTMVEIPCGPVRLLDDGVERPGRFRRISDCRGLGALDRHVSEIFKLLPADA